jgi:flavin-binding protein dodecin
MTDHTYKVTEIVGSSADGIDAAITSGIARASESLRNLGWFEVTDIRGHLEDGAIAHYQVTMKVGFRLDDD